MPARIFGHKYNTASPVILKSYQGVGLSFCVRRLGSFFKGVLRPQVTIFGVLRPPTFWRPRSGPNFYGVLRLTLLWRPASGLKIQTPCVLVSLKIEFWK